MIFNCASEYENLFLSTRQNRKWNQKLNNFIIGRISVFIVQHFTANTCAYDGVFKIILLNTILNIFWDRIPSKHLIHVKLYFNAVPGTEIQQNGLKLQRTN